MSFRFIEDHRAVYPVRLMCAVLEVSPAGYYAWRERPVSARATSNSALLAEIRQVHRESGQRYGSPGSMLSCGRRDVTSVAAGSNG
jgi:hypothetical protein